MLATCFGLKFMFRYPCNFWKIRLFLVILLYFVETTIRNYSYHGLGLGGHGFYDFAFLESKFSALFEDRQIHARVRQLRRVIYKEQRV